MLTYTAILEIILHPFSTVRIQTSCLKYLEDKTNYTERGSSCLVALCFTIKNSRSYNHLQLIGVLRIPDLSEENPHDVDEEASIDQ